MKTLIEKRFKELGTTQAQFCEKHGYDNSNFHRKYKRLGRNLNELKEFFSKIDIELKIENKSLTD